MMMDSPQRDPPPPISFYLKRGTLIGAASGMLAGMVYLAIQGSPPETEVASIITWRNFILTGAGFGFLLGGVGWWVGSRSSQASDSHTPTP